MAREWQELNRPLRVGIFGFWSGFAPRTSPLIGLFESVVDVEFVPLSLQEHDVVLTSVFGGGKPDFLNDTLTMQYIGEPKSLFPESLRWGDYQLGFQPDSSSTFWLPHWLHDMLKYDRVSRQLNFDTTPRPAVPKTEFCAIYASHDRFGTRGPIVAALNEYKEVHSYGAWNNNRQGDGARNNENIRSTSKMANLDRYKFALAIENSAEPYYTTEKLSEAAKTSIPVYWGDPKLSEGPFNLKRMITGTTPEDILEQVILLDNDDASYKKMLKMPIFSRPVFPKGVAERSDVLIKRVLEEKA
jgi:hypothetical protein